MIFIFVHIHVGLCMPLHMLVYSHLSTLISVNLLDWWYMRQGKLMWMQKYMTFTVEYTLITVYHRNQYMECVSSCAETSMQCAVDDVKCRPEYSTEGEV